MEHRIDRPVEQVSEAVGQIAVDHLHERVARELECGVQDPVGEHQSGDRRTAERPCPQQAPDEQASEEP